MKLLIEYIFEEQLKFKLTIRSYFKNQDGRHEKFGQNCCFHKSGSLFTKNCDVAYLNAQDYLQNNDLKEEYIKPHY